MAQIQLYQQSELPPNRIGQVKPSFALADQSSKQQAGQVIAGMANEVWSQLLTAKVNNEKAIFFGAEKTARANFSKYVTDKPFANKDDIKEAQGKMISEIEAAGQMSRLPDVKNYAKGWMAENKEALLVNSSNDIIQIIKKREQENFNTLMDGFKADPSPSSIDSGRALLKNSAGTLIDNTPIKLPDGTFTSQYEEMDKAFVQYKTAQSDKLALEQAKTEVEKQAFTIAATNGYDAAEEMLRDPSTRAQLLEIGMSREDAKSLISDISENVKHNKVITEESIETQREVDRGSVYDFINTGVAKMPDGTDTTDIRKYIESTSLDEDEQEAMWQKSIKETDRKLKGTDLRTDQQVRSKFYRDIPLMLSGAVSRDELLDRANNARFGTLEKGGITGFPTKHPSVKNADGSKSNVLLSGFEIGGKEYVIPTMVGGEKLTDKQAVEVAKQNGLKNYPSFDTVEEANKFAEENHNKIDANGNITGATKLSEPTISDTDYKAVTTAINAQYEQGYGQMMARVNDFAEGILLKTDSLGFVENAPVREKQLGDFQQAWFELVAGKGENLKLSEIYPEGRKLAATFQISDLEAAAREDEFNKELYEKEGRDVGGEKKSKVLTPKIARRYLDVAGGDRDEAKRLAAEDGYKE